MDDTSKQNWIEVKSKLILIYGTISAAAATFECHSNSLRHAVEGRCPHVKKRMDKAIQRFDAKKERQELIAAQ